MMSPNLQSSCCGSTSHPRKPESKWSWLVCTAGTYTWALSFGMVNSYAVVMPVIMDQFKSSREGTAWTGSIPSSLTFACIPVCSKVVSYIGIRLGALVGTFMCALSLILTSFTTSLLHIFFSYCILFGVGCSMIFTSSVLAMTKYFNRRQGIALGFLAGGPNLGVLTLGPLLQELIGSYGFRTMYRIMASFFVPSLLLVLSYDPNVQQPINVENHQDESRNKPKETGFRQGLKELFKKPIYLIALFSLLLQNLTDFVTHVHLVNYCQEVGRIPSSKSSKLLIAIGLSSLLSSVIAGRVVDIPSVNPFHVNQVGSISMALSMLLLQLATKYYHFVIFTVFLGLGCGILVTTSVILLLSTVEPRLRSVSFPFGQLIISLGNLTGPPLIGFIADKSGSYKPAFFTAGGVCLVGFLLPFLQHCFKPWREPIKALEVALQTPLSDYDHKEAIDFNGPSTNSAIGDSDTITLHQMNKDVKSTETSKPELQQESNDTSKVEKEPLLQDDESNIVEPLSMVENEANQLYELHKCDHPYDQAKLAADKDAETENTCAESASNTIEDEKLLENTSQRVDKEETENHIATDPTAELANDCILWQEVLSSTEHHEEIENPNLQANPDILL